MTLLKFSYILVYGSLAIVIGSAIVGCTGISDYLSNSVTVDAVQHYTDAGGTSVELIESDAVAPVRTQGIPTADGYFEVRMIMNCSRYYNVTAELGADATFWLAQDVFFTYDSDSVADRCNVNCVWHWKAEPMTSNVATVTAQCEAQ